MHFRLVFSRFILSKTQAAINKWLINDQKQKLKFIETIESFALKEKTRKRERNAKEVVATEDTLTNDLITITSASQNTSSSKLKCSSDRIYRHYFDIRSMTKLAKHRGDEKQLFETQKNLFFSVTCKWDWNRLFFLTYRRFAVLRSGWEWWFGQFGFI